ncbi:MAG: hypothetical protein AUJ23_00765 [Candidatus Magasanikbacteria bacterium CG1_02_32_51]|uniref:Uncharacterized protein n=1 Tax=Candidatus Magasanikbacteria bacterium CG1_02_32_51 TaxID=1805238 RepID=A0A1J4U9W3_9BACT|nr:MAG: hypothetical protein AUJ23_00765 [Candidatus Magasanikbacteria bacterium CG1_02_32_51]
MDPLVYTYNVQTRGLKRRTFSSFELDSHHKDEWRDDVGDDRGHSHRDARDDCHLNHPALDLAVGRVTVA